jgi:hypothetical protein
MKGEILSRNSHGRAVGFTAAQEARLVAASQVLPPQYCEWVRNSMHARMHVNRWDGPVVPDDVFDRWLARAVAEVKAQVAEITG